MKKIYLFLVIITLTYLGCKKDVASDGPGEIYGKWRLTETLNDPGDGSGKYMKVTGDAKYLILDKSGKISGEALSDSFSFKVIDSVRVEIFSNTYKMPITYRYKVSARSLTLNPPCIEGCGLKFVRE